MEETPPINIDLEGGWNYRVFKLNQVESPDEPGYVIREVYYNLAGEPVLCSVDGIAPHGESMDSLVDNLFSIADAIHQPVLTLAEGDKIIEVDELHSNSPRPGGVDK